jgi:hypothetical protein
MGCENLGSQRLFLFLRERGRDFLGAEFFVSCCVPAGGEQHLQFGIDVGHVVVA